MHIPLHSEHQWGGGGPSLGEMLGLMGGVAMVSAVFWKGRQETNGIKREMCTQIGVLKGSLLTRQVRESERPAF